MSATFVTYGDSACWHYRTFLPARATQNGFLQRDVTSDGEVVIRRAHDAENGPGDVVVYHQPFREWQGEDLDLILEAGSRVVVDVDDDLWAVAESATHPFSEQIGEHIGFYEANLNKAHAFTTATPFLAEKLRERSDKPVFVCPNGMDPWRFNIRKHKRSREFVVGWAGAVGHEDAWAMIGPQVSRFLRETPRAVLLLVGSVVDEDVFDQRVWPQIQHAPWMTMGEYIPWLSRFNVGLAPAVNTDFYHAKSPLRLFEYQAANVPTIASETVYGDHILDGVTGWVAADDGWYEALKAAYSSPRLARVGDAGRNHLMQHNTIEQTKSSWAEAIRYVRHDL